MNEGCDCASCELPTYPRCMIKSERSSRRVYTLCEAWSLDGVFCEGDGERRSPQWKTLGACLGTSLGIRSEGATSGSP